MNDEPAVTEVVPSSVKVKVSTDLHQKLDQQIKKTRLTDQKEYQKCSQQIES